MQLQKQALKAAKQALIGHSDESKEVNEALVLIDQALAEQPAQTDWEAVAADQAMTIALLKAEQPAQQEPVGYWQGEFSEDGGATLYEVPQVSFFGRTYPNIPLYTSPPAQPQQEPVALQEIARLHDRIKDLELDVEFLSQSASKQELVALGALAKRRIFDYIRGAYDLGYNDARNSRAIPGDGAPGYKGRDVEADHGSALFHALEAINALREAPAERPSKPDYVWPTVADYERDVGFQTNEAFRVAWDMARTTNTILGIKENT